MPTQHERALTQRALDTLTTWGRNPSIDGGENIAFSMARQGVPGDELLSMGDCTPFTPTGRRGILKGQPVGFTGAPIAYVGSPPGNQVPCTFSFNLNTGKVLISGPFPNLPPNLKFTVGFLKKFTNFGGKNIVFYSEKTSDKAGYVIAFQLVAAS